MRSAVCPGRCRRGPARRRCWCWPSRSPPRRAWPAAPGAAREAARYYAKFNQLGAKLEYIDVGGGFPSIYPGMEPAPLEAYFEAIVKLLGGAQEIPLRVAAGLDGRELLDYVLSDLPEAAR